MIDAALCFIFMWALMAMLMMAPALAGMLYRYRGVLGDAHRTGLSLRVAAGYFAVWAALGMVVLPIEALCASHAPIALLAGCAVQLTPWKRRHLALCCALPEDPTADGAVRHGVQLGTHCVQTCAGYTLMMLAAGMTNLYAMAAITLAITVERFASLARSPRPLPFPANALPSH